MTSRYIHTDVLQKTIVSLIYEANFLFDPYLVTMFRKMKESEATELGRYALEVLIENSTIAQHEEIPLCQDCGMVIVFLEIGSDVVLQGKNLEEAINKGVEEAYQTYYLRKSIVSDPLRRVNTGTNTPCIIHTEIVSGDHVAITVYLKGGGSENMSALKMFRPTDSMESIIDYIVEVITLAGPNPCPPLFLGVGIGGSADSAMLNAKKAVVRGLGSTHQDPFYRDIEREILRRCNTTNIGPLGFGGRNTVAHVSIKEAPTHIATLPVALNLNCHSLRFKRRVI